MFRELGDDLGRITDLLACCNIAWGENDKVSRPLVMWMAVRTHILLMRGIAPPLRCSDRRSAPLPRSALHRGHLSASPRLLNSRR